jgi:hypothetical protein
LHHLLTNMLRCREKNSIPALIFCGECAVVCSKV